MRTIDTLCAWLAVLSGLFLMALIGLTFFDVIFRYIFSAPIFGARDLLEMGMVLIVSLAFPFTWRVGGHIVVDLIPDYGIAALTVFRDIFVRVLGIILFALLAWRAVIRAEDSVLFNEATNMIQIPFGPLFWILAAGSALQVIVLVAECIARLAGRPLDQTIAWAKPGEDALPSE